MTGFADGNAMSDRIVLPVGGGTYTANYEQARSPLPSPWLTTDVGNPLMLGSTDFAAASQTFYLDGAGADVWGAKEEFHAVYQPISGDSTTSLVPTCCTSARTVGSLPKPSTSR